MAKITITVPDDRVSGLLDAFAAVYPIPVGGDGKLTYTKAAWARMKINEYLREVWKASKGNDAAEVARQGAVAQAESDTAGIVVA